MAKLSDKCNIQIPMEVFKWVFFCSLHFSKSIILFRGQFWLEYLDLHSLIDDGKNPDEFTRDVINSCIAKNQITKGKTDTFKVSFTFL